MKHLTIGSQCSPRPRLSERSINVRCPSTLTNLLDAAAASKMTTPSGYVRRAVIAQLRADGILPHRVADYGGRDAKTAALLHYISTSLPPAPIDKCEDFLPEFTRRCTWYHYEALAHPADDSVIH